MSKSPSYHWSPSLEPRFCAVLAETGSVRAASRAVGMSAKSAYAHRKRDAGFAKQWYAAVRQARDVQLDILMEAAISGFRSIQVRNADTGRAGWRRVEPMLGRGRGMGLLNRLDRALERAPQKDEFGVTFGGKLR